MLSPTGGPSLTLAYAYDDNDRLTTLIDDLANPATTTYAYNSKDRLTSIDRTASGFDALHVGLTYDAADRLTTMTRDHGAAPYANTLTSAFTFTNDDALTDVTHTVAGVPGSTSFGYTWDAAARVATNTDANGTLTYTYDVTNQLTAANGWRTESYSYDLAGNRTMSGYTTSAGNQLDASPGRTYTYDFEGNRTTMTETATGDVTTYVYDHRNRLTSLVKRDSGNNVVLSETFTYDPMGRRIVAVHSPGLKVADEGTIPSS